ncbi:DUF6783 domain-containing protein [Blautia wexlerae]
MKYPAKWGVLIAEMIFQTRSRMNFGYVTENGVNSHNFN